MSASSLAESGAPRWRQATLVSFRFAFTFLILFFFPFPLNFIPFINDAAQKVWDASAVAVGKAVFGVSVNPAPTGSGDKIADWVTLFAIAVVSAAVTLIWSVLDRKAASYPRLYRWFHLYIRFGLALAMISYGAFKVIPSQFIPPTLDRLLQPFGDASPMGLLWTFMGASVPYMIFTGLGEMTGGLLLTNRRTALLGALITAAVMTHVVMLNFAFDVPVKNYSVLLLVTALIIAAPDAKKLLDFFILQRPSEPMFSGRGIRIAARVLTVLFVLFMVGMEAKQSWQQRKSLLAARFGGTPLYGIWNVDELTIDGVAHPPLTTDLTRWRRFVVSGSQYGTIQNMDDSRTRFNLTLDEKKQTLTLKKRTEPSFVTTFNYRKPDARTFILDGTFEGKKMVATMHKGQDREFLLTSRGFHWINEVPFNR
jgi:hypothetical protein